MAAILSQPQGGLGPPTWANMVEYTILCAMWYFVWKKYMHHNTLL